LTDHLCDTTGQSLVNQEVRQQLPENLSAP